MRKEHGDDDDELLIKRIQQILLSFSLSHKLRSYSIELPLSVLDAKKVLFFFSLSLMWLTKRVNFRCF